MGNCILRPDCPENISKDSASNVHSSQRSRRNTRQHSRRRRHSSRLMMKLSFSHRRRYSINANRFSFVSPEQFNKLEQHLIVECFHGNYDAVMTQILDIGEDVDQRDAYGETPLTISCAKGHFDIVKLLIEEEANVNKKNKEGWSPLMIASQNGHFKIVELLARHKGCKVDTADQFGVTSLMLASEYGHRKIAELLIEMHANMNLQDNEGVSALILASGKGHKEIVTLLVERGADKHMLTKNGESAIDVTKRKQHQQKGIERILSGKLRESFQEIPHASVDQIAAEVGISSKLLDQPFSEDLKMRIAQLIPNWLEYAEPLKLTKQEINGINTDPQLNFCMKTQELLATWYRQCAYTDWSHYRVLVKVSCELGLADVAGKICKVIKENSALPSTDDPDVLYISRDLKLYKKASIGGGMFGSVFKGELNGKPCALKVLHFLASEILMCLPTAVLANNESVDRFRQECEYLKSFKHPNIVQHLATETHPKTGHLVLVLELLDCNLRQYFSKVKELTIAIQTSLCYDIILALAEIHCRQIVHRDLCADNVLLDTRGSVPVAKVSDFGMSKIIQTKVQCLSLPVFGHRGYLPPEADTDSSRCDSSFDIFQFGVLMLQIVRCLPSIKSKQERINEQENVDSAHPLKDIIKQCLLEDSFKRPSANELQRQLQSIRIAD